MLLDIPETYLTYRYHRWSNKVRPDLEDPPHVPLGDGQTMLVRLSELHVYGMPVLEGALVQARAGRCVGTSQYELVVGAWDDLVIYICDKVMDVLSLLGEFDDEGVIVTLSKPVINHVNLDAGGNPTPLLHVPHDEAPHTTTKAPFPSALFPSDICRWGKVAKRQNTPTWHFFSLNL
ncbi:hypothetical protein Tco_0610458 [Tanacetum coccineum]